MGVLSTMMLFALHPMEARAIIQLKIWRDPLNDIKEQVATSRYDQPSMRKCWDFLDLTSRSFAFVCKELQGDLCRVICIFYLVLRALDTVEDDMTINIDEKVQVLETFHEKLETPGWTYNGSGPDEKDAIVLKEFNVVIEEFALLDESYRVIIKDICRKMGRGMAHYCKLAHKNNNVFSVQSLSDFDLYCHYVAGVVGEGLVRCFGASGLEMPELGNQLTLANHMGLYLQKTNITRDFREDVNEGRLFWPKAIWGKYANDPKELTLPENKENAIHALNEIILDSLQHTVSCLEFLCLLKNQSIFNFCAIPQVMAIATLAECFGNPQVFQKNVKIRRSTSADIVVKSTNQREVAYLFRQYIRAIHAKVKSSDPNYIKICVICGQIEQWVENRFPSWLDLAKPMPRTREEAEKTGYTDARIKQLPSENQLAGGAPAARAEDGLSNAELKELVFWMFFFFACMAVFMVLVATAVVWFFDDDGKAMNAMWWGLFRGLPTRKELGIPLLVDKLPGWAVPETRMPSDIRQAAKVEL